MLDLNEDGHWGRRNIFDNVTTTRFGLRFEGSVQLVFLKGVNFIGKVHPLRGFMKMCTVNCVGTTVSECTYYRGGLIDGVNWAYTLCTHGLLAHNGSVAN